MDRVNQAAQATVTRRVNIRKDPTTRHMSIGSLIKGIAIVIEGWVENGQPIEGNSRWLFDANGNYFWSGAFSLSDAQPSPGASPSDPAPPSPQSNTPEEPPVAPVIVPPGAVFNFTPSAVKQMIPAAPLINIQTFLPSILSALYVQGLSDNAMILMALATVATETGYFQPISEGVSKYNTSPGASHLFDLYDYRSDLGNNGPPDGELFKGRGFVQLTGRSNYTYYSYKLGLGDALVADPGKANDPVIASQLLAFFLKSHEAVIRKALASNNLASARKAVNGGLHGIDVFSRVYNKGAWMIASGQWV